MKKSILILGSILFITITMFSACQLRSEKVENEVNESEKDLADSKTELYNIRLDTISNYERFKIEAEKSIIYQEKNITEFKAILANEKNEKNADYERKMVELDNKNNELRKKLADYNDDGQDKWVDFKNEFNYDMNELVKALNDLTVENKK
jgi:hypothetical protein